MSALAIYWPALFALGVVALMCLLDPTPPMAFPPAVELTGAQACRVLSSPYLLATTLPVVAGLFWLSSFAKRAALPSNEHASMVWWLVCAFWFHIGCDVLSGYYQVMPMLTDLYARMTPAHEDPRWSASRGHLDAAYVLELYVEAPLALLVLALFARRHPARFVAEASAAGIQLAGTIAYYAPGLARGEAACWLSWVDRACGSVWIVFPLVLIARDLAAAGPLKDKGA